MIGTQSKDPLQHSAVSDPINVKSTAGIGEGTGNVSGTPVASACSGVDAVISAGQRRDALDALKVEGY